MDRITCQKAANITGNSLRKIQQMCKNGEIKNAKKEGKSWSIPLSFCLDKCVEDKKKNLPLGTTDYKRIVRESYYIDKTLIIKDIIDKNVQVNLFTRPRRFGKTLMMDMLKTYFEKTDKDTSIYFVDKAIWNCGEEYQRYQGKYPVIYLSFKDIKCLNWEQTLNKIKKTIALEYNRHYELEKSEKLSTYEKNIYLKMFSDQTDVEDLELSVKYLSHLLYKHYEKECIIIIDEYDTPITYGYSKGFYNEIINFMRNFFSSSLKDNSCLAYGFLTGILRVAKESIFSGLNNVKINTILDDDYSSYFGFTKDDVKQILSYYDRTSQYKETCEWYDGYQFGHTDIFNPWSIINYVSNNCKADAYWVATSGNEIISELIDSANNDIRENLYALMNGKTITTFINLNIVYPEINTKEKIIYSFLLLTGYLKISNVTIQDNGDSLYDLSLPNKEIKLIYEREILEKLGNMKYAINLQKSLIKNDIQTFQKELENYLLESISVFDGTNEGFYQGMMLGLCSTLTGSYQVQSNLESGYGRFDIELLPKEKQRPGFIFELKYDKDESTLEKRAIEALEQIEKQKYDTILKINGIQDIKKIGIAFCGKKACIKNK